MPMPMPFPSWRPSQWQNVSEVMRATWWLVQLGSENSHSVPMDFKLLSPESNWGLAQNYCRPSLSFWNVGMLEIT